MISLLVFGRNDSHGHFSAKRVALSLNTYAEQLAAPDDEILFVDYNSPDTLPTLPEAIVDTLTLRARHLIRVLRVRPAIHDRFAGRTPLPILAAIASNTALRRTNPVNHWVLVSTTDMIVVSQATGISLSEIAANLPDGFYELPRFELPESLWETLDRNDPLAASEFLRLHGRRLSLDEIVRERFPVQFTSPGDFQLAPRADLLSMSGHDEDMLFVNHIDANLSRRAQLFYGRIESLESRLLGYHCGHSRLSTTYSRSDRLDNDATLYVDSVVSPFLPHQSETWGLADVVIEEIRLDDPPAHRYRRSLMCASMDLPNRTYEAELRPHTFDRPTYPTRHVLPYLLDCLTPWPPTTRVLYVGFNQALVDGLDRLRIAAAVNGEPIDVLRPTADERDLGFIPNTNGADILIVDFGIDEADYPDDERLRHEIRDRQDYVLAAFDRLMDAERRRMARLEPARLFLIIDGVHRRFTRHVLSSLDCSAAPFSTRVHSGFVKIPNPPASHPLIRLGDFLGAALGTGSPFVGADLARAVGETLRFLRHPAVVDHARQPSAACLAVLEWPELPTAWGFSPHEIEIVQNRGRLLRQQGPLRHQLRVPLRRGRADGTPPACSKLPSPDDWDCPDWDAPPELSEALGDRTFFGRDRSKWERRHFAYILSRYARASDGPIGMVLTEPDVLPAFLARTGWDLVLLIPDMIDEQRERVVKGTLAYCNADGRGRISTALLSEYCSPLQVVFAVGNTALLDGPLGLVRFLTWADSVLLPGGMLAFSAEVAIGRIVLTHWLGSDHLGADGLDGVIGRHTSFQPIGTIDGTLAESTLDHVQDSNRFPDDSNFVVLSDGCYHTNSFWVLGRQPLLRSSDWAAVAREISSRYGDLLPSLHAPVASAIKIEGPVKVPRSTPAGLILSGPRIDLAYGRYELSVQFEALGGRDRPYLRVEVVLPDHGVVLACSEISGSVIASSGFRLTFDVPPQFCALKGKRNATEFRFYHLGEADLVFRSMHLRAIDGE